MIVPVLAFWLAHGTQLRAGAASWPRVNPRAHLTSKPYKRLAKAKRHPITNQLPFGYINYKNWLISELDNAVKKT